MLPADLFALKPRASGSRPSSRNSRFAAEQKGISKLKANSASIGQSDFFGNFCVKPIPALLIIT